MPGSKDGPSVTKTLISLIQSDPSNRSCADCRSALVDPSDVYASLCPSLKEVLKRGDDENARVAVAIDDFPLTHRAFAPPDVKRRKAAKYGPDPAISINQRFGGHGLFVCTKCAAAHRTLGDNIAKVMAVQDATAWTKQEANFMKKCGGNSRSQTIYEAYITDAWKRKRPNSTSALEDRVVFCKAKYEALAFVMPPPGPLSKLAWAFILERSETAKRFNSPGLKNIHRLGPASAASPSNKGSTGTSNAGGVLPDRLIDFFCVVSSVVQLHPKDFHRDLSKIASVEDLYLWPQIADCYPSKDAHSDMLFPEHLPSFVLPNGCCPSMTQKAPTFYTFVLTLGDGDRLYGGALEIYDEHIETEELKDRILSSGYEGALPPFLKNESDIVFLPKCLILLSHHPFFDMFRESLLQLYRITLVEAPLPIERYIANLVSEVPLPPPGKVRVEFGFTTMRLISIERPATNQLPLANFSYRPLFASLSVGNIMVVLGCFMEECKVALLSSHCSVLTPVAEALMSALYPFEWQGLYIPMMPYSMLDILDAPVPFVVGLDSRYLQEIPPKRRPMHVVFVDLDRDVIYMGVDDVTNENRIVPPLPARNALKLKTALEGAGGSVYLLPNSGIKGCIMEGHKDMLLLPNEHRPKYAQMQSVTLDADSISRSCVLARTKKAYDETELAESIPGFRTVHGQMKEQNNGNESDSSGDYNGKRPRRPRKPKFMRNKRSELLASSLAAGGQAHLLDMDNPDGFSPPDIRNAFLRFMVATFANYGKFIIEGGSNMFDEHRFLRDFGEEKETTAFVGRFLKTQIFQRFLEERMDNPDHHEIRFFDESILAKLNRSKRSTMAKGGPLPTPFLEDESYKITKTYTPPPPSNLGLPDSIEAYHYNKFPSLDLSLVGRVRPPIIWEDKRKQSSKRMRSSRNMNMQKAQQDIVKRAMLPLMAPAAIAAAARKSAKDLESALSSLRGLRWDKNLRSLRSPKATKKNVQPGRTLNKIQSTISVESTESERTVTTLSKADTIMMNARRKQSILLDLVVSLQATCRMYIARKRFSDFRRAVVHVQRKFRHIPTLEAMKGRPNPNASISHILAIQRDARRFLARRWLQKLKMAVATLQHNARGHVVRRRYTRQRSSALMIQKHIKGRRDRFAFCMLKMTVCKVQACVRGFCVRNALHTIFESKMALFRREIVSLWQASHVPLSLRTKFWPTFSSRIGFARLRVAESELIRTWQTLGVEFEKKGLSVSDDATEVAKSIGIDMKTYCICQELSLFVDYGTPFESLRPGLMHAYEFEEAERLQIHERLDIKASEKENGERYQEFGIPPSEKMKKKKKVALARSIWSKYLLADCSRATMLALFPELDGSLNIVFQNASNKSKRRFKNSHKSPSSMLVGRALWDEISLEGLIKKHNTEVTRLFMTKVPSLMAKLDNMDRRKCDSWRSMRSALRTDEIGDIKSLSKKERELIHNYLYPLTTEIVQEGKEGEHVEHNINEATSTPGSVIREEAQRSNGTSGTYFPDISLEISTASDHANDDLQFPDIDLDEAQDEDPVKNFDFPDIGLDEAPEDIDPLKSADFPEIDLDEDRSSSSSSSVEANGVLHQDVTFPLVDGITADDLSPEPADFPDLM